MSCMLSLGRLISIPMEVDPLLILVSDLLLRHISIDDTLHVLLSFHR